MARKKSSADDLIVRARDGVFRVGVAAWPPSKANQYQLVSHGGRPRLISSEKVHAFQQLLSHAVLQQMRAEGLRVDWALPDMASRPPSQRNRQSRPKPVNPLFGADIEVDVELHLYEPVRSNRDTDGADKVTFDVLTDCGVWRDDRQVGDRVTIRASHVGERETEYTEVVVRARPTATWLCNKTGRPTQLRATDATAIVSPIRPVKEGHHGSDPDTPGDARCADERRATPARHRRSPRSA